MKDRSAVNPRTPWLTLWRFRVFMEENHGLKTFKSIEDQIKILKGRGLAFNNEEGAKNLLLQYGYYEIVNGYKDSLVDPLNKFEERYIEGASDTNLRVRRGCRLLGDDSIKLKA
jgi:hypothetical protein